MYKRKKSKYEYQLERTAITYHHSTTSTALVFHIWFINELEGFHITYLETGSNEQAAVVLAQTH